jgi:hypothetical protein
VRGQPRGKRRRRRRSRLKWERKAQLRARGGRGRDGESYEAKEEEVKKKHDLKQKADQKKPMWRTRKGRKEATRGDKFEQERAGRNKRER